MSLCRQFAEISRRAAVAAAPTISHRRRLALATLTVPAAPKVPSLVADDSSSVDLQRELDDWHASYNRYMAENAADLGYGDDKTVNAEEALIAITE